VTNIRARRGRTGKPRTSVPLSANGLELVVEPVISGPLSPAITIRVYAARRATSVGATVPARYAEALAEAIVEGARRAV
jgi:hypothetical protein